MSIPSSVGGYKNLPPELQGLLKKRFAFAIQQSTLSSKARGDKQRAQEYFSKLKAAQEKCKAIEEHVQKHGCIPDVEVVGNDADGEKNDVEREPTLSPTPPLTQLATLEPRPARSQYWAKT